MPPIELLYAKNTIARHGETGQQELVFALLVQNLAYDKYVEVIWAGEDGTRHNLKADYVAAAGEDLEIWQARAVFPLAAEGSLPGDIHFVLHGYVAGRDYWHPSNHHGWWINADSGILLGDRFPLLNVDFQPRLTPGHQFYPITVGVRRDLQAERVAIRWTTNHWRTFTETPAFFWHKHWHRTIGSMARNPNRYGCAVWISQLHLGDAYQVEYALLCEGKGRRHWDNNCGRNYLARHAPLRIMTLNLHCYQEDRQDEKFSQIVRAIQDLQIDVVCLQEVGEPWNDGRGDWNSNAAKLIRDRLGESFSICTDWSHLGFERYREGVAILSRYPFLAQESRYVSATQDAYDIHARRAVMARIRVPYFGAVNVFSVHLSWWENGFREQFENLRRWAESKQTPDVAATFLCGDFNNAANTAGYSVLSQEYEDQFLKANSQHVCRADDHRIDYLLMKRGNALRVLSAQQLFTREHYGLVSDHEGYCAEFDPPT
jgi:maltose 6'-phosphate phosphatase